MSASNATFGPTDIVVDRRPDGTFLVRSPHELGPYPERMTERLDHWAQHASYRTFLAQRDANGRWRNVTYAEAQYFARRIAQALLNRGLSVQNPVVTLSGNDIEHVLLSLGAAYAGVPFVPLPPHYALTSTDFEQLRYVFKLLTPGLIFAADGKKFEQAVDATLPEDAELVVNENPSTRATTMFADLVNTEPIHALDHAYSHVNGDTVLRITFTSGPGETPGGSRGMVQTHRMWASNQEMARFFFRFLADEPPVLVDWLGNISVVLYNGGSYYMDDLDVGFRNLRVITPTMYWNLPQELKRLIAALRSDPKFQKHFFSKVRVVNCVGEGIPAEMWDGLAEKPVPVTAIGSTEYPPHWLLGGAPPPGVELKLVPKDDGKLDVRSKGLNVTWGYWRNLEQTRGAFDEEGFLKTGESVCWIDEADPAKGLIGDAVHRGAVRGE